MLRLSVCFICLMSVYFTQAQDLTKRLNDALKKMETDPQLKHAVMSFYVADSKTGKLVCERNSQVGLAPASCQKVITSVAAFDLLGQDYRYKTVLSYDGGIENGVLKGNLHITGSGDPTLGSWRWSSTREILVLENWISVIKKAGIRSIEGIIIADNSGWSTATIPDGWIWQDIGNYYGAGASWLNWRENQYDIVLRSGKTPGELCSIISISPKLFKSSFICEVKAGEKGSGDNAYIYLPVDSSTAYVRGTIPTGETAFTISGSFPNSSNQLTSTLSVAINGAGVKMVPQAGKTGNALTSNLIPLFTNMSPSFDSINYWFLKKSINLYGEALMKTIAFEKDGFGSTERGVEIVKYFWSQRGIEKSAINIFDGSGLAPQNRVTTEALVKVMQYARSRPWFIAFYKSLPEINGITMKSGSIGGARSYTGYVRSKDGTEYTFAIIVNNYDGNTSEVVRKIWALLDILK